LGLENNFFSPEKVFIFMGGKYTPSQNPLGLIAVGGYPRVAACLISNFLNI